MTPSGMDNPIWRYAAVPNLRSGELEWPDSHLCGPCPEEMKSLNVPHVLLIKSGTDLYSEKAQQRCFWNPLTPRWRGERRFMVKLQVTDSLRMLTILPHQDRKSTRLNS